MKFIRKNFKINHNELRYKYYVISRSIAGANDYIKDVLIENFNLDEFLDLQETGKNIFEILETKVGELPLSIQEDIEDRMADKIEAKKNKRYSANNVSGSEIAHEDGYHSSSSLADLGVEMENNMYR